MGERAEDEGATRSTLSRRFSRRQVRKFAVADEGIEALLSSFGEIWGRWGLDGQCWLLRTVVCLD